MSAPRTVEFWMLVERFDDGYINHGGRLFVGRDEAEAERHRLGRGELFRVARLLIEVEPGDE